MHCSTSMQSPASCYSRSSNKTAQIEVKVCALMRSCFDLQPAFSFFLDSISTHSHSKDRMSSPGSLPPECLEAIFSALLEEHDTRALARLLCVSKDIQSIALPLLYDDPFRFFRELLPHEIHLQTHVQEYFPRSDIELVKAMAQMCLQRPSAYGTGQDCVPRGHGWTAFDQLSRLPETHTSGSQAHRPRN